MTVARRAAQVPREVPTGRERRAARARFYASKYEERAKALRTEDRALEKANKDTPTEK